jgi:hypothetical protein
MSSGSPWTLKSMRTMVYLDKRPISCATLSISKYGSRIDNA